MARMDGQLVAIFRHADELVDVRAIELRIHALAEHVHGQRDDVDIAGALAIAEERALDAVGAREQAEFGGGDGAAAVIVRMERDRNAIAVLDVAAEPFDLVGMDVGRRHLDGCRQVEDELLLRRRPDLVHHRLADLDGVVEFRAGEALRAVLEADGVFHAALLRQLLDEARTLNRDLLDALAVLPEHDAALQFGCRVVEMHDRRLGASNALEGARDQFLAALDEHLHGHVIGNLLVVDERAAEVEIRLRGGGKSDLDFLEAHLEQAPRTSASCGRGPWARSATGCRRGDRRNTRSGGAVMDLFGPLPVGQWPRAETGDIFRGEKSSWSETLFCAWLSW